MYFFFKSQAVTNITVLFASVQCVIATEVQSYLNNWPVINRTIVLGFMYRTMVILLVFLIMWLVILKSL